MRTRFLTVALALAGLFAVQHADAKKSTKNAATSKKHHKKHAKKTGSASRTAPPAKAAPMH
jgi:hypothetical protein